jgi:hypothetical protein
MTTPPPDWATGVREGTAPVGAIPAEHANVGTSPIYAGGDADAGGADIVSGSVAGAVSNSQARYGELSSDTYGQGSQIGDSMNLPSVTSDWSKHTGSPGSPDAGSAG